jgi:hypothetical protein
MVMFLCRYILYAISDPIFAFTILYSQLTDCLPLIHIFIPDRVLYLFLSRMVLKLPTAGNTSIAYFVLIRTLLLSII